MAILEQTMKLDQAVKAAQAVAAAKASGEARAIIDAGRDALAADLDKKLGHTVTGDRCLHALRALCHSGNFRNGAETSGTALHALRALCSQPCTQLHARCTVRLARRVGSGLHRTRVYAGCRRQSRWRAFLSIDRWWAWRLHNCYVGGLPDRLVAIKWYNRPAARSSTSNNNK